MKRKHDFQGSTLRFRMVLLVSLELLACMLLAIWVGQQLDWYEITQWNIPLISVLLCVCLCVMVLVTAFLSRLFFNPVKKLREAMEKVAKGDFTVKLHNDSNSREIRDIYAGFNLMTEELASMEVLQTDFVSNVSHEFKTPLGAIEGYSTLLQDCDNLTPQQREYVEKIIFSTQRLSRLTGSILLLSKLENQQIPTGRSRFSLDEQIRQTIVEMEPVWAGKDIELDVEMEEADYFGSELLMGHVWSNLLSNALKFSPPGGTVAIRLTRGDGKLIFRIRDWGPGIPDEAMTHIFTRFYQGDSSHKQEGNGLGLALVDKILKLEKGTIQAENCPDGGCRFTVTLENE